MIKIKEIAFFCYAVNDMPKARAFYEGVLGLKSNGEYGGKDSPNYVEYDIGPTTLAIGYAPGMWKPSPEGASAALEVEDFDKTLEELTLHSIKIATGPHDFPSCRMVVITDPDGNKITLHKRKKEKKT